MVTVNQSVRILYSVAAAAVTVEPGGDPGAAEAHLPDPDGPGHGADAVRGDD